MGDKHTYVKGYSHALAEAARAGAARGLLRRMCNGYSLEEFAAADADRADLRALARAGLGAHLPTNKANRGIGDFITKLLLKGLSTGEVIEACRERFPTAPVTSSYVADYRRKRAFPAGRRGK